MRQISNFHYESRIFFFFNYCLHKLLVHTVSKKQVCVCVGVLEPTDDDVLGSL